MLRDSPKTSDDVRDMTPKDPSVGVEFVDDDEAQVLEELRPAGVVREDPRVEHVRVGHDYVTVIADSASRVRGGVTVEGERSNRLTHGLDEIVERDVLVLGEGLGGEDVQRTSLAGCIRVITWGV